MKRLAMIETLVIGLTVGAWGCGKAEDCADGRYDSSTGLCWQHPRADAAMAWQDAMDYCDSLELGGHGDWRLPDRRALVDVLDGCDAAASGGRIGACSRCENSGRCSALFGPDSAIYWSSWPRAPDPSDAWFVSFYIGAVGLNAKMSLFNVRCVRSGP